jgi:acyl carrier protein
MSISTPNGDAGAVTAGDLREILVTNAGVAAEVLDGEEHTPLEQLGVDSLAVLEFQSLAAQRYGVEIPDDALQMSVSGLVQFINQHAGSPAGTTGSGE